MSAKVEVAQPQFAEAAVQEPSNDGSIELEIGTHKVRIKELNGAQSLRLTAMIPAQQLQNTIGFCRAYASVRELDGRKYAFPEVLIQVYSIAEKFSERDADKLVQEYMTRFGEITQEALKNS